MPIILVLFAAMTIALAAATIATGFGRVWGPVLIAVYSFGMLAWYMAIATPGTLEAWLWGGLTAAGIIEAGVAILLAPISIDRSWSSSAVRRASRVFGTVVAVPVTGFSALLTLVGFSLSVGGMPFVY